MRLASASTRRCHSGWRSPEPDATGGILFPDALPQRADRLKDRPQGRQRLFQQAGAFHASGRIRLPCNQNFRFKPAHITIKRGTRVRWINRDSAPHTVTANKAGSFDSGHLRHGQRYSHTFKKAGKKAYHCEIHPFMRGSVLVKR